MPKWGSSRPGPETLSWGQPSRFTRSRLGRYQIVGELGTGASGVVYAAFDPEREQTIALKVLGFDKSGGASLNRFRDGFATLSRLAHPNLVQLYDFEVDEGIAFCTMEAVRGCDPISYIRTGIVEDDAWPALSARRPQRSSLATTSQYARLREVLGQVASGLVALHGRGMVHRDIKPENVLVTREGRAVVLDFGLLAEFSMRAERPTGDAAEAVGTAAYMAPEQAAGERTGPAADWYSFGVFLYEAVSGTWPFEGVPIRVLMRKQIEHAPSLREVVPDAPSDLTSLCAALLEPKPDDRPVGENIVSILVGRSSAIEIEVETQDMPPFVGRHTEIGHLEQAFGESHGRRPITMVLRGASGVGKSELARRFLDRIEADFSDVITVRGRCHRNEQTAYRALDGVMSGLMNLLKRMPAEELEALLPSETPLLCRLFPALRRLPAVAKMPALIPAADPRAERDRAFASFAELLRRVILQRRLLIFIDDLQWADADSLALLGHTLQTSRGAGFMFLVTVRADDSGEVPPKVAQLLAGLEQVRVLSVQALPVEEATHLAHLLHRRVTGKHASALLAQSVAEESAGCPLVIDELIRYVGEVDQDATLKREDALWARVRLLDAEPRSLLEVICVSGYPLRLETAAAAAGLAGSDWAKSAAVLRLANFARTTGGRGDDIIEAHHDRIRDVVLDGIAPRRRTELHQRIAEELEAEGVAGQHPQLVLQHFAASGELQRAMDLATQAATRAREAMAFDRAAELYRWILEHVPENLPIWRELAQALSHAGRGFDAALVYLELASQVPPAEALESRRLAACEFIRAGDLGRGLGLLSGLSARPPALSVLRRLQLRWGDVSWTPRSECEIAPVMLRRHDVLCDMAGVLALTDRDRAGELLDHSLLSAQRIGDSRRVMRSVATRAIYLAEIGRRDLRQEVCGEDEGDWSLLAQSVTDFVAERYQSAASRLVWSVKSIAIREDVFFSVTACLYRLSSLLRLGRVDEFCADASLMRNHAERRGDYYLHRLVSLAGSTAWLFSDESDRVVSELSARVERHELESWLHMRALVETRLYRGESCHDLVGQVEAVTRSGAYRRVDVRAEQAWLRGRMALAGNDLRGARRAARRLERMDGKYARVCALLLRGGAMQRMRNDELSARYYRDAAKLAASAELSLLAAVAQTKLAELAGNETRVDCLREHGIKNGPRMMAMLGLWSTSNPT